MCRSGRCGAPHVRRTAPSYSRTAVLCHGSFPGFHIHPTAEPWPAHGCKWRSHVVDCHGRTVPPANYPHSVAFVTGTPGNNGKSWGGEMSDDSTPTRPSGMGLSWLHVSAGRGRNSQLPTERTALGRCASPRGPVPREEARWEESRLPRERTRSTDSNIPCAHNVRYSPC